MQRIIEQKLDGTEKEALAAVKYTWQKDEIAWIYSDEHDDVFKVQFTGDNLMSGTKFGRTKVYKFKFLEAATTGYDVTKLGNYQDGISHGIEKTFFEEYDGALESGIKIVEARKDRYNKELNEILCRLNEFSKKKYKEKQIKKPLPTTIDLFQMTVEEKLDRVDFFVEADSFAVTELWVRYYKNNTDNDRLEWSQDSRGHSKQIGCIHENESLSVILGFSFYIIGTKFVCFYYPTSRYSDWGLIEEWIDKNYPVKYDFGSRRARTDATNFGNCYHFCKED